MRAVLVAAAVAALCAWCLSTATRVLTGPADLLAPLIAVVCAAAVTLRDHAGPPPEVAPAPSG